MDDTEKALSDAKAWEEQVAVHECTTTTPEEDADAGG